MQTQITNAFAALNQKIIERDQEFAVRMIEGLNAGIEKLRLAFEEGSNTCAIVYGKGSLAGVRRVFSRDKAKIAYYGSKAMYSLLDGRSREDALKVMRKNTDALIAKRDAQIIKALTKAGIKKIPEFTLVEHSDGCEGWFNVAGHHVTIRTIYAGGYNIQRFHTRTLVKVTAAR